MSLREVEAIIVQLGHENAELRSRNFQLLGENFRLRSENAQYESECSDLKHENSLLKDKIQEFEFSPHPLSASGEPWCNYDDEGYI